VFALARFSTFSIHQEKFRRVIFQTDPLPPGPAVALGMPIRPGNVVVNADFDAAQAAELLFSSARLVQAPSKLYANAARCGCVL
jgi:hypothetical protein